MAQIPSADELLENAVLALYRQWPRLPRRTTMPEIDRLRHDLADAFEPMLAAPDQERFRSLAGGFGVAVLKLPLAPTLAGRELDALAELQLRDAGSAGLRRSPLLFSIAPVTQERISGLIDLLRATDPPAVAIQRWFYVTNETRDAWMDLRGAAEPLLDRMPPDARRQVQQIDSALNASGEAPTAYESALKQLETVPGVVGLLFDQFLQWKEPQKLIQRSVVPKDMAGFRPPNAAITEEPSTSPPVPPVITPDELDAARQEGIPINYYIEVKFPQIVQRWQAKPLIVRLRLEKPQETGTSSIMSVAFVIASDEAPPPEYLTVRAFAPDFDEETQRWERTITVRHDQDSDPAIFLLKGNEPGKKRIAVDFIHKGRPVGSIAFMTEVNDRQVLRDTDVVVERADVSEFARFERNPPPPADLQLRVVKKAQENTLAFWLDSPLAEVGYRWEFMGETLLTSIDPKTLLARGVESLNKMAGVQAGDLTEDERTELTRRLTLLAEGLFEQLLPERFREEYFARILPLQERGVIKTLLITSDESWIPWELLKPYHYSITTNQEQTDDFWVTRFCLSRWLAGRGPLARVDVKTAALVVPGLGLPGANAEINFFDTLSTQHMIKLIGPISLRSEVLDLFLTGGYQILHVVTYAQFDADDADDADQPAIELADDRLYPSDLRGSQLRGIRQAMPLVFLNACLSSRSIFGLTGLGGWAEKLFKEANASVFVGAQWEVHDLLSAEFSRSFYSRLAEGDTLGEAMLAARMHVRNLDPVNPTWLAYSLYGDPNGLVRFAAADAVPHSEVKRQRKEGRELSQKKERAAESSTQMRVDPETGIEWYVDLLGLPAGQVEAFSIYTLSLRFSQVAGRTKISVPTLASSISIYVDVQPGLELLSNSHVVVDATDGKLNLTPIEIIVRPINPGNAQITLSIHVRTGVGETFTVPLAPVTLQVSPITVLPNIPELVDVRTVPYPDPDVRLYATIEPIIDHERDVLTHRLQIYLTCPTLGWDMMKLDPLPLNQAEIAEMNQTAARTASQSNLGMTGESEHVLCRLGMLLYDLLAPQPTNDYPNTLRRQIPLLNRLARELNRPLTWLVISDPYADLPWEMLWPYGVNEGEEGFLGEKHIVTHWISRLSLKLRNEVPVRKTELLHYQIHSEQMPLWNRALGGAEWVSVANSEDALLVAEPGSDVVGLHLVNLVEEGADARAVSAGYGGTRQETILQVSASRRLDLAAKHPLVGLSLVARSALNGIRDPVLPEDTIQRWVIPMLRAEASAVIMPRWPVIAESDQLFFHELYVSIHQGTELGQAVLRARHAVRQMFPFRGDWLAYTCFGHPQCAPYWVSEIEAFATLEVLNHPREQALTPGQSYEFRATYGSLAPAHYDGRVFLERPMPDLREPKIEVSSSFLDDPIEIPLERKGQAYAARFHLTVPSTQDPARLIIFFLDGDETLEVLRHTLPVNETLDSVESAS